MPEWMARHLPDGWDGTEVAIAAISAIIITMVISILACIVVMVRIPQDYFVGDHPPRAWADRHALVRWPLIVGKNLLGVVLILLGIVMSFPGVPGQGILTVLIGAMLMDFPGKRKSEKWLLARRGVLQAINRIRGRYGRPPLMLDVAPAGP